MGRYNVSTYYHKSRNLQTLVHGDDFVTSGSREDAAWLKKALSQRFDIKTAVVGRKEGEEKETIILNRIIRVKEEGWEYEADQRHGELIVKTLNMEESKAVVTPGEDGKSGE